MDEEVKIKLEELEDDLAKVMLENRELDKRVEKLEENKND